MNNLITTLIYLTTTASSVIVFVLIFRFLLKKAPKIYSYALWSVVLFRLLCPFSFESQVSIVPTKTQETFVSDLISESIVFQTQTNFGLQTQQLPNTSLSLPFIMTCIWALGVLIMLGYSAYALVKTKKNLLGYTPLKDNIYLADNIKTPFVMGVLKPKIYLPSNINDSEIDFIIMHEKTHIKRFDHITRILAFVALCVHWFNPFVWFAYTISAKDMEMSCDEAVMNKLGVSIKKEYASSLLRFEAQKHLISPLAFSEGDTKGRVKNIMKHKKTKVWVSAICVVAVCVTAFTLLTNAKEDEQDVSLITGYININESQLLVDQVEILTSGSVERIEELGLDIEQDLPSGYLILNEEKKVEVLKLTDETKFIFMDFRQINEDGSAKLNETTSIEEFINGSSYQELDLENLEDRHYIPYFIEIQNGVVITVTEDFRYTI
ncbi:MAG: M56 family metallopeptidase [Eubacteriales bacterium]